MTRNKQEDLFQPPHTGIAVRYLYLESPVIGSRDRHRIDSVCGISGRILQHHCDRIRAIAKSIFVILPPDGPFDRHSLQVKRIDCYLPLLIPFYIYCYSFINVSLFSLYMFYIRYYSFYISSILDIIFIVIAP